MILTGLEDLAQRLGLTVRYEGLGDDGLEVNSGRCRLRGEEILLIERRLDQAGRIDVLSRELKKLDLQGVFIRPYLRQWLGEDPADD